MEKYRIIQKANNKYCLQKKCWFLFHYWVFIVDEWGDEYEFSFLSDAEKALPDLLKDIDRSYKIIKYL